jgi:hypothetical protein
MNTKHVPKGAAKDAHLVGGQRISADCDPEDGLIDTAGIFDGHQTISIAGRQHPPVAPLFEDIDAVPRLPLQGTHGRHEPEGWQRS